MDSWSAFIDKIEIGGFLRARHCGSGDCEDRIKDETKATIRVLPFEAPPDRGPCVRCGSASTARVVFARAY